MSRAKTAFHDDAMRLLGDWDEWEGGVLLDGAAWDACGGFQVDGDHFQRYLELQARRTALRSIPCWTELKASPEEGEWERIAGDLMDQSLALRQAVHGALGYLFTAKIALETYAPNSNALVRVSAGIDQIRSAIRNAGEPASESAPHSSEAVYVRFSEDGTAIRKWSRVPFEGACRFDCRGTMPPLSNETL